MNDKFCPRCFKKFGSEESLCPDCKVRLVAALDKDLSGEVLDDRYEVVEVLGKGGMGVVYRARQKLIDRPVALKVLRRELIQDESSVKRFLVEAKAISSLRSPHTVTLYDFGITQDGLLYFTMELLDGIPLSKLMRKEGPLPHERVISIALQVCDSLKEAHSKGILHRDLKPDNIYIIRGESGKEHCKVLDFGIAKILDDGTSESITRTGMICGTPMYLSPEQAMGKPLDARSDIYSLGVILYEMLAGEPPFMDATPMGILLKQINEEPPPLSVRNPAVWVPEPLEKLLLRILAKNPDERPESVARLMEFLESVDKECRTATSKVVPIPSVVTTHAGVRIPTSEFGASQGDGKGDTAVSVVDQQEKPEVSSEEVVRTEESQPILRRGSKSPILIAAGGGIGLVIAAVLAVALGGLGGSRNGEEPASVGGKGKLESTEESMAPSGGVHVGSKSAAEAPRAGGSKTGVEDRGALRQGAKGVVGDGAAAREKAEAKAKARKEAEARGKAEAEAKAKREAEARAKAEAEVRAREEAEARKKAEAEAKAKQEAEARAKAEAQTKAREEDKAREKAEEERKETQEAAASTMAQGEAKEKKETEASPKAEGETEGTKEAAASRMVEAETNAKKETGGHAKKGVGKEKSGGKKEKAGSKEKRQAKGSQETKGKGEDKGKEEGKGKGSSHPPEPKEEGENVPDFESI